MFTRKHDKSGDEAPHATTVDPIEDITTTLPRHGGHGHDTGVIEAKSKASAKVDPLDDPEMVEYCRVHAPQCLNRRKEADGKWVDLPGHKLSSLPHR